MICENCKKEIKNEGALIRHKKTCELVTSIEKEVIRLYLDENKSITEIKKIFKIGSQTVCNILGDKKRTLSEGTKLSKKKYPEKFKHSEETKSRLRELRLEFMKKNPEKTAWRMSNLSYPEKIFFDYIKSINWDKKFCIIREFSFFPYYIDFAFPNEKIAVEIDGSQHLDPERKKKDENKDELLIKGGWKVIRISENEIKNNLKYIFLEIEKILSLSDNKKTYRIGIILNPKKKQKKERSHNGLTELEYVRSLKQRKVTRPEYPILIDEIKSLGYSKVGEKYGVSDNSIRKWKKFYEKKYVALVKGLSRESF